MQHIAIIGAGGIGSRHLQSLSKVNKPLHVVVVDPNPDSLKQAEEKFTQAYNCVDLSIIVVSYFSSLDEIINNLDIAIIATNADIREKVISELIQLVKVRYVIIEKVAFQSLKDFRLIIKKFDVLKIKSWVNCTRRMVPLYKNIREILSKEKKIEIEVKGYSWGIASNTIHMLDLFAYLTGEHDFKIDIIGLDKQIYPSKRDDMVEFRGTLKVKTAARNDILTLVDKIDFSGNNVHTINSENYHYTISHSENTVQHSCKEKGWIIENDTYVMPYQSDLTHILVKDLIHHGDCDLTPIIESYDLHSLMLNAFGNHLKELTGNSYDSIPIT